MDTCKKVVLSICVALTAMQINAGNFSELDQSGINIIIELSKIYDKFIKATESPRFNFDIREWNFLVKTNVKSYVEDYAKVKSFWDREAPYNKILNDALGVLLRANNKLLQQAQFAQVFNVDNFAALSNEDQERLRPGFVETLLQRPELLEQTLQNAVIPNFKRLSASISASDQRKAREMLIRVFDMMQQMAAALVKYSAAALYTNEK